MVLIAVVLYCLTVTIAYRDMDVSELKTTFSYAALDSVNIDGVELYYQVHGPATKPAVLLLHSHYFTMRMWDNWIDPLSEHFRVIRFDMTSHGLTGPDPSDDYSMARSQQLINGLLKHLNINEVSIVGSSLGGNMAFTFAAEQPTRVSKLVLMNSGGLKRQSSRSGTIPSWVDTVFYFLPKTAYRALLEWMIVDDSLVQPSMVNEFHSMFRRQGNRVAELNRLRGFKIGDPDTTLSKVTAPTLLMWGEANPQLPVALVGEFKQKLRHAQSVQTNIYPHIGHVIPLEMPTQGARDLVDFLLSEHTQ